MEIQNNTAQIDCFWDEEYQKLEYCTEPFNNPADVDLWNKQGYKCNFVGAMCDMRKTQPTWNHRFVEYFSQLGWKDVCTSYYRMDTCTILPLHRDIYAKYIDLFNLKGKEQTIRRAIVFLEDWASGHYLELNNCVYTGWRRGFCVMWSYDEPHMAANIGVKPRYSLQITGHI